MAQSTITDALSNLPHLLIETNQHEMLDGVILVDAPESEQLKRGAERDSKSRDTIQYISMLKYRDRRD